MRFTEKGRRELIQKLTRIRDPRERDKLLWLLAGHDEDTFQGSPPSSPSPMTKSRLPQPDQPEARKTTARREMPEINIDVRRMIGFVVPAFFVLFGLIRLIQAALNYIASREAGSQGAGLVTGGILLIIGLAGIYRALQTPPVKQDEGS